MQDGSSSNVTHIWNKSTKSTPASREVFFNIMTLVEDLPYSLKPLMQRLGITRKEYDAWECGESDSFMQMLPEIASFYDVPVEFLLDESI